MDSQRSVSTRSCFRAGLDHGCYNDFWVPCLPNLGGLGYTGHSGALSRKHSVLEVEAFLPCLFLFSVPVVTSVDTCLSLRSPEHIVPRS